MAAVAPPPHDTEPSDAYSSRQIPEEIEEVVSDSEDADTNEGKSVSRVLNLMSHVATPFSDWRSFNKALYEDMRENGEWDLLLSRSKAYLHANTPFAARKLVVRPEELPLTNRASAHLSYLMDAV